MFHNVRNAARSLARASVERGAPPAWYGYRWVRRVSLADAARQGATCETVHREAVFSNPLPQNVPNRDSLPRDAGWWGYSFWDVPERTSAPTQIGTLPACRVVPATDERGQFWVSVLNQDGAALEIREMAFRPYHRATLLAGIKPARLPEATWVLERVYDNHSHWLTAHLPKFVLLRDRGELQNVVLPERFPESLARSLRMLGIDPDAFRTFDPSRVLEVDRLTLLSTDRFRPDLLRPVRDAMGQFSARPTRRVFVSRSRATRRRLVNKDEVWPVLEQAGFERVWMEALSFEEQVSLMGETAVLAAPHGAGLTNMLFCPEGTHVIELADLSFPNPNFYALASALGLSYWLVPASPVGDGPLLERDMHASPEALRDVLARLPEHPRLP